MQTSFFDAKHAILRNLLKAETYFVMTEKTFDNASSRRDRTNELKGSMNQI